MAVLLAYDGKPASMKALGYAIEYSSRFEVPLYILTVVKENQMDPEESDPSIQEYMQEAQREAASSGVTAHTIIKTGKPGDMIIETSMLYECDTIISGRTNRSNLDRAFMGSVSEFIIKHFDGLVILVPEDE